jgi:hypothetical protein
MAVIAGVARAQGRYGGKYIMAVEARIPAPRPGWQRVAAVGVRVALRDAGLDFRYNQNMKVTFTF